MTTIAKNKRTGKNPIVCDSALQRCQLLIFFVICSVVYFQLKGMGNINSRFGVAMNAVQEIAKTTTKNINYDDKMSTDKCEVFNNSDVENTRNGIGQESGDKLADAEPDAEEKANALNDNKNSSDIVSPMNNTILYPVGRTTCKERQGLNNRIFINVTTEASFPETQFTKYIQTILDNFNTNETELFSHTQFEIMTMANGMLNVSILRNDMKSITPGWENVLNRAFSPGCSRALPSGSVQFGFQDIDYTETKDHRNQCFVSSSPDGNFSVYNFLTVKKCPIMSTSYSTFSLLPHCGRKEIRSPCGEVQLMIIKDTFMKQIRKIL